MTLDELARNAEAGDAEAQYCLGVAYMTGSAGECNWEAAQRWIIRAAANGYPGAHELAFKLTRWVELDEELLAERKTSVARFRKEAISVVGAGSLWLRSWDAMRGATGRLRDTASQRLRSSGEKEDYGVGNPVPESISLRDSA